MWLLEFELSFSAARFLQEQSLTRTHTFFLSFTGTIAISDNGTVAGPSRAYKPRGLTPTSQQEGHLTGHSSFSPCLCCTSLMGFGHMTFEDFSQPKRSNELWGVVASGTSLILHRDQTHLLEQKRSKHFHIKHMNLLG